MSIRSRIISGIVVVALVCIAAVAFLFSGEEEVGDDDTTTTLFMTFVPNIQFAPVYVAIDKGFWADKDLNVRIEHGAESDGVDRIATNDLQFGIISGEQVILARSADKPVVYVMEWYHRYPIGIVTPAESDIKNAADLAGRKVSVPVFEGASYVGLLAFLGAVDLDEQQLELESVGYGQVVPVMCERDVDAAVVYIANEPLQIASCYDIEVIEFSDYVNLVSNGLITNETTITENPELVQKMVNGLQRGIEYTVNNPDEAFEISLRFVPDLSEEQFEVQRTVLERSIPLWEAETIGVTTREAWQVTQDALIAADLLDDPLSDLDSAYTNVFVMESPE